MSSLRKSSGLKATSVVGIIIFVVLGFIIAQLVKGYVPDRFGGLVFWLLFMLISGAGTVLVGIINGKGGFKAVLSKMKGGKR